MLVKEIIKKWESKENEKPYDQITKTCQGSLNCGVLKS